MRWRSVAHSDGRRRGKFGRAGLEFGDRPFLGSAGGRSHSGTGRIILKEHTTLIPFCAVRLSIAAVHFQGKYSTAMDVCTRGVHKLPAESERHFARAAGSRVVTSADLTTTGTRRVGPARGEFRFANQPPPITNLPALPRRAGGIARGPDHRCDAPRRVRRVRCCCRARARAARCTQPPIARSGARRGWAGRPRAR